MRRKLSRARLYEILEKGGADDPASRMYDHWIQFLVILSALPLMLKFWSKPILLLDRTVTIFFLADYFLRWMTADFKEYKTLHKRLTCFLIYPFTPMAIVDLLSIMPVVMTLPMFPDLSLTTYFYVLRIMRLFRCVRLAKTFRYSKNFTYIMRAFSNEKRILGMVLAIAIAYIFIAAAVMFSAEPDTFGTFFDALYWATATLTTVGYGDIYPLTTFGRGVSMLSSVFGIAIVAMPSGIITAAFLQEVDRERDRNEQNLEQKVAVLVVEIAKLRHDRQQRALDQKVELLLHEIQDQRRERQAMDLEGKLKLISDEIHRIHEDHADDTLMLQDLSDELAQALARSQEDEDLKKSWKRATMELKMKDQWEDY